MLLFVVWCLFVVRCLFVVWCLVFLVLLTVPLFFVVMFSYSALGKLLAVAIHLDFTDPLKLLKPYGVWEWMMKGTNLQDAFMAIPEAQVATGHTVGKKTHNRTMRDIGDFMEQYYIGQGMGFWGDHPLLIISVRSIV